MMSTFPPQLRAGSVPGVPAHFGAAPSQITGTFAPGARAMFGVVPVGAVTPNRGVQKSQVSVVQAYVTKRWTKTKYHESLREGMLLFNVRAPGHKEPIVPMAAAFQLNDVLRRVYESERRLGRVDASDREIVDEMLSALRENGELFTVGLGARESRNAATTRRRALAYQSAEGIFELWNFLGVHQNDGGREAKNEFQVNVVHQGPAYVDNVFPELIVPTGGGVMPQIRRTPGVGQHCHYVLRRRTVASTGEGAEFYVAPLATQTRIVSSEARYYVDHEGYDAWGPTWYVGEVLDTLDQTPDARNVLRMRGIGTPWRDAYEAHGACEAKLKLAIGAPPCDMATA